MAHHPILSGIGAIGAGGAALAALGTPYGAYEAYRTSQSWRRAEEASHMSRLLATAQFGAGGPAQYGMRSDYGNSDGLALALHYARNGTGIRNPFTSMVASRSGVGFLRAF